MGYHKSDASFDKEGKKLIRRSDSYYRDIPCNKDIYRAYCIGSLYGIMKNKTDLLEKANKTNINNKLTK